MISVIVPVLNAARSIERCLDALLRQDYAGPYEILVVDNNSTDDSMRRVARDRRVRMLQEPAQGSYQARNRAVREAQGELLAFTDSDCVADSQWLSSIDGALRNPPTQVVLGSRAGAIATGLVGLIAAYDDARVRYIVEQRRSRSYFGFTNNMAVRRTAFERHGPFDHAPRGSDTLFLRRVAEQDGAQSVCWSAGMRVRHLELRSAGMYIRKNFLYARARSRTRHLGQCQTLSPGESLEIFRGVIRGRRMTEQISLALALSAGRLSWTAGSLL